MIHVTKQSAAQHVANAMINAEKADKFMVAVWSVGETGELTCHRTTWQFPVSKLDEAVRQLDKMVREEIRPTSVPLPLASFLRPTKENEKFPADFEKQVFSAVGVPPAIFKGEARPIEMDETVSDLPGPPIVNAVMPLDSEDGE